MNCSSFGHDPRFVRSKEKELEKNKNKYWDYLPIWTFPKDQPIWVRPVSHPQHNPDGIHPYTVHLFTSIVGQPPKEILCTESLSSVRKDADGSIIKKSCFFCDLYSALEEVEEGSTMSILDRIESTDTSVYNCIEEFNPFNNRKYNMPALIRARINQMGEGKQKKTEVYPDQNACISVILQIKEKDGLSKANPGGFLGSLGAFVGNQNLTVDSPTQGNWFSITHLNYVGFQFGHMTAPSDLYSTVPNFEDIMKHYPQVRSWGQVSTQYKKSKEQSYNYSLNLVKSSWMGDVLVAYGVDWGWFSECQQTVPNISAQQQYYPTNTKMPWEV
jgi:hypothetical protein